MNFLYNLKLIVHFVSDDHKGVREMSATGYRVQNIEHNFPDDMQGSRCHVAEQVQNETQGSETVLSEHGSDRQEGRCSHSSTLR